MTDWPQARQLFKDGLDTSDIAKLFGVHESVIYNGLAVERARRISVNELSSGTGTGIHERSGDETGLQNNARSVLR